MIQKRQGTVLRSENGMLVLQFFDVFSILALEKFEPIDRYVYFHLKFGFITVTD
jgi:hypothetical protein